MSEPERSLCYGADHLGDFVPPYGGATLTDFLLARIAEGEAHWGDPLLAAPGKLERRVLADHEAKRQLIADLNAETHEVVDGDCWFTCAAATEERDGGTTCRDDVEPRCECGRDKRMARRLGILALPYADHEDYRDEWRL